MNTGHATRIFLVLSALGGCARHQGASTPDERAPNWLDMGANQVPLCFSSFPEAPRLRQGRSSLAEARDLLAEGRYPEALILLQSVAEHPEREVHLAGLELLQRQVDPAWQRIRDLIEEHPSDPCLERC